MSEFSELAQASQGDSKGIKAHLGSLKTAYKRLAASLGEQQAVAKAPPKGKRKKGS